jgi:TRAP-type mannitol/chloroaromatic compound transport system permease small subunit
MIDALSTRITQVVRWLALVMVLVTVAVVVLRYAFAIGAIPLQESVIYMHGVLFMLGIPYGVLQNTHVRVDIIYSRLNPRQQDWVDLAGHLLFLLPLAAFIFVTSLPYVAASWRVLEGSAEVGGLPAIFILKTLIPTMAALLFLQGLSEIAKHFTNKPSHS